MPLQAYFHQGGHGGAPPLEMMNKWFTRYLYGVENGVEREPKAWIVRETRRCRPRDAAAAAERGQRGRGRGADAAADAVSPTIRILRLVPVTLHLARGRRPRRAAGARSPCVARDREARRQRRVRGAGARGRRDFAAPADLRDAGTHRAAPHFGHTARDAPARVEQAGRESVRRGSWSLPWTEGPISPANLITRGWADPQNHRSLQKGGNYHSRKRGEPLAPGRFYDLTFDLQPDDQIIPAGKRIGLMIFSSDRDFTLWPAPGTELTIDLDRTSLRLPVVGGITSLERAGIK